MPVYTLVVTGLDGHQHAPVAEFASDEQAIGDAAGVLSDEHRSTAVARGSGEALEFLGVWDRGDDGKARWTADD